jgi:hypothetical protein
LTKDEVGEGYT